MKTLFFPFFHSLKESLFFSIYRQSARGEDELLREGVCKLQRRTAERRKTRWVVRKSKKRVRLEVVGSTGNTQVDELELEQEEIREFSSIGSQKTEEVSFGDEVEMADYEFSSF